MGARVHAVFSAVKKKGSSIERPSLAAEDDDEAGAGDVLANPEAWDAETRRAWEQFVKGSKLGEGEMWDAGKQDEGLPKVWVDLDKE